MLPSYWWLVHTRHDAQDKKMIPFRISCTLFDISAGERGRGSMVGKLCVFFIWGYWHLPISSWSTDFITHCCRYLLFMMVTQQQHLTSQYFSAPVLGLFVVVTARHTSDGWLMSHSEHSANCSLLQLSHFWLPRYHHLRFHQTKQ